MTEPRTEAGRRMLYDWHARRTHPPSEARQDSYRQFILTIEAEATAAAEQRLRSGIEAQLAEAQAQWETVLDPEDGLMENGRVAALNGVLALFGSAPPPPPASPRQGEPVDVARLARAMNDFERHADLSAIVESNLGSHRADCAHVVLIAAAYAAALSDPAEPVAPDKEGNG